MIEVLKTFVHLDGKHRVHIVRRAERRYGYEEEYFSDDPHELCWIPCSQRPFSICDSIETAEREARGAVVWLRDPEQF